MAVKQIVPSRDALRVLRRLAGCPTAQASPSKLCLKSHAIPGQNSREFHGSAARQASLLRTKPDSRLRRGCASSLYCSAVDRPSSRTQSSVATASVAGEELVALDHITPPLASWPTTVPISDDSDGRDDNPSLRNLANSTEQLDDYQADGTELDAFSSKSECQEDDSPSIAHSHLENRVTEVLDPRYELEYARLHEITVRNGPEALAHPLQSTLMSYVSSGLRKDWNLAKQLYIGLCYDKKPSVLRRVRNEIVQHMLQQSPPRLEAVEILCARMPSEQRQSYKHLTSYLTSYCSSNPDPEKQLQETENILKGMQIYSVPLHPTVTMPMMRDALEAGQADQAYRRYQLLQNKYDLQPSTQVLAEFIRGWGKVINWSQIDSLLLELHQQGLSRSRPEAFAGLVHQAVLLFGQHSPDARIFDYLTYSLRQLGLVPSAHLSRELHSRFIRTRSFHLLQKWNKESQDIFPGLLSVARDPFTAHNIANAWASINASSFDVLNTCKALAYGAVRNPFSDDLRFLATETMATDLARRCKNLAKSINYDTFDWDVEKIHDIHDLFNRVHDLLNSANSHRLAVRRSLHAVEIIKHLDAAQDVALLLGDINAYMNRHGPRIGIEDSSHVANLSRRTKGIILDTSAKREAFRKWSSLKTIDELQRDIEAKYAEREARGQSIDDSVLHEVLFALTNNWRYHDISNLLQQLAKTKRAKFIFTLEVYSAWVTTTIHVQGSRALSEALWSFVESPPSVELPARFLLLVRLAKDRLLSTAQQRHTKLTKAQLNELEYLVKRVFRRKWYQMGFPEAQQIQEPNMRKWRENLEHDHEEQSQITDQRKQTNRSKKLARKHFVEEESRKVKTALSKTPIRKSVADTKPKKVSPKTTESVKRSQSKRTTPIQSPSRKHSAAIAPGKLHVKIKKISN